MSCNALITPASPQKGGKFKALCQQCDFVRQDLYGFVSCVLQVVCI